MQHVPELRLPNLMKLGLGAILASIGVPAAPPGPLASYGRCRLAYRGADSYLGHQEIMGTIPKPPVKTLMAQAASDLARLLEDHGHKVEQPLAGVGLLVVDSAVVIGDNLEADPGLNINLTVATDALSFERALEIGKIVREAVRVSRVIVFGGPGITVADILRHARPGKDGQMGIDSPALGVYNENLRVQHLGYGVDPDQQAASILAREGVPVILLGKMADLVVCSGASKDALVSTPQVMKAILHHYEGIDCGLVAATVQETDLAAHERDLFRLAAVLEEVDSGLEALLPKMARGDVLIVCADHGNDPQKNTGLHTREETPLLLYRAGQPAAYLGVRDTLADIGATITHLFGAPRTQDGSIMTIEGPAR
jgi:phosphopentomutase